VAVLPEVPSMQEAGVPGYELTWWVAAWAPAGTPRDIVSKMTSLISAAISAPKTQEFFLTAALEPFATSSDELMKFQVAEHEKWRRIIKTAGIEPQ
jgi:tripartite-type tricarboxylate transporter receptor subunit TctC